MFWSFGSWLKLYFKYKITLKIISDDKLIKKISQANFLEIILI